MSTPEAPEAASASAPAPEIPDPEAEVYAASAAENALPSDKQTPSAPDDLSALSEALDAAVLDEKNPDAHNVVAAGDAPAGTEETPALSKEEMVEEALACPCIAAMRDGPCGEAFTSAYRCFLESETEPKGMNCIDSFSAMQTCMVAHPEDYPVDEDGDPNLAEGTKKQPDVAETKSAEGADVQQTQAQTAEVSSSS